MEDFLLIENKSQNLGDERHNSRQFLKSLPRAAATTTPTTQKNTRSKTLEVYRNCLDCESSTRVAQLRSLVGSSLIS